MDDDYDSYYGIEVKTWFATKGTESNSYYVIVEGWRDERPDH